MPQLQSSVIPLLKDILHIYQTLQATLLIYHNLDLKQIEIPQLAIILILAAPEAMLWWWYDPDKDKGNGVRTTVVPLSVFRGSLLTSRSPCPQRGKDTTEFRNKEAPEREHTFFYPDSAAAAGRSLSLALPSSPVPSVPLSSSLTHLNPLPPTQSSDLDFPSPLSLSRSYFISSTIRSRVYRLFLKIPLYAETAGKQLHISTY